MRKLKKQNSKESVEYYKKLLADENLTKSHLISLLEDMDKKLDVVVEAQNIADERFNNFRDDMNNFRDDMNNFRDDTENNFQKLFGFQNETNSNFEAVFDYLSRIDDEIQNIKKELKEKTYNDEVQNLAKRVIFLEKQFSHLQQQYKKLQLKTT